MDRFDLLEVLDRLGVESIEFCGEAETAQLNELPPEELPEDVYVLKGAKGTLYYARFPNGKKDDSELHMGLLCNMAQNMDMVRRQVNTIKNCIVFFTVVTVISVLASLIIFS